jgi:predicted small metal-binding protein
MEIIKMAGFHVVCPKRTNGSKCSTTLSADTKPELLEKALDHVTSAHGLKVTMGLKQELNARMRKGRPSA